jgi:hypothetical protein
MEATRVSLRETVQELRGRVSETMDWRTYVDRYAGVMLVGATVAGVLVGRAVGTRLGGNDSEARTAEGYVVAPSERASIARSGTFTVMRGSWSRAGSRLEGIVNRVIDELADLLEHGAVPAMMARLRAATRLEQSSGTSSSDFTFHAANR